MSTLLALMVCAAGAGAPPTAPPPTPKPGAGAYKPFDLTYLPRTTHSVLAVRPGEIVKQLGDQSKIATDLLRRSLAAGFAFLDGDLKAATPPTLAEIEQIVLSAHLTLDIESKAEGRSNAGVKGVSSGLIRTFEPFDWAGAVKKWFPKAEMVKHGSREYLQIPLELGKETSYLALFVADDRTLVFDTDEDEVKGLLDRLDKKMKPSLPAGWDEVCRDMIALCHDTTTEGWLTAPEQPKRELDQAIVAVARKSTSLAVGLSAGEKTSLRIVATARDDEDALNVRTALKAIVALLANEDEVGAVPAKLFAEVTVKRDGEVVRAQGAVPGNLLRLVLDPDAEH